MSGTILETRSVSRAFGGLVALNQVDLQIETGKITAIIGPNGAGKTTLFNLITGVYAPTEGEILFEGRLISKALGSSDERQYSLDRVMGTPMGHLIAGVGAMVAPIHALFGAFLLAVVYRSHRVPPARRAKLGIVRTYQHAHLFGNMTALENVMTGQHPRSSYGFLEAALRLPKAFREEETITLNATKYLNMVGLGMQASENAMNLPLGQQKLLAIARALATEPRLLLLDEPGAGLNRLEKRDLSDLIRRIRDMGVTVVLVEHDMPLVMGLAERVIVLDTGRKIAEGTASQIQKDKKVIAAYLGDDEEEY